MTEKPNCGNCPNAEKTNSELYPFKCAVTKPVPMMVHKYCVQWFEIVGCLLHPGAREYLMKDVIKELERRMETLHKKSYLERIEEYKKAISLIRGDGK